MNTEGLSMYGYLLHIHRVLWCIHGPLLFKVEYTEESHIKEIYKRDPHSKTLCTCKRDLCTYQRDPIFLV